MTKQEAIDYAKRALANPAAFKVCQHCRCLWEANQPHCTIPACGSVAFFTDAETVRVKAHEIVAVASDPGTTILVPQAPPTTKAEARIAAGHKILARPDGFAVCECCNAIVTVTTSVCPACLGYAINRSAELVRQTVQRHMLEEPSSVLPEDLR